MRELWDKYGPWLMIAVVAVGFLRVVWGREAFCGSDSEHCFREWVSALGGWAAVAAAIPTIYYLSRQVKDAQDQHRHNVLASRQPSIALARSIEMQCAKLLGIIDAYSETMSIAKDDYDVLQGLDFSVDQLHRSLHLEMFSRFELEVGHPATLDCSFVRSSASDMRDLVKLECNRPKISSANIGKRRKAFEEYLVRLVQQYVDEVRTVLNEFKDETARLQR